MSGRTSSTTLPKVRDLRTKGYSVPEIARELKISKTTAWRLSQGIPIAPAYQHLWFGKRGGSKRRQHLEILKAKEHARTTVSPNSFILAALYWAEGSKKDFNFVNSDPQMIKFFVSLLRSELAVSNERLTISLRLYGEMDEKTCKEYWSNLLDIPIRNFKTSERLPGREKGKFSSGLCRIRVSKGGYLVKYLSSLAEVLSGNSYPHSSTDRAEVS